MDLRQDHSFMTLDQKLRAIEHLTRYPSIPTYHALNPKNGGLIEEGGPLEFTGNVIFTEKIDGANGRIIVMPNGFWFIGSRTELLTSRGDLIPNPKLGIVENLEPITGALHVPPEGVLRVYYFEVYGGTELPAAKKYTTTGRSSWRMFDVADFEGYEAKMAWDLPEIALWRDNDTERWFDEVELHEISGELDLNLTPRLGFITAEHLPQSIDDTWNWLTGTAPYTKAAIDKEGAYPEGIVLRTEDRRTIAKARLASYQRTRVLRGIPGMETK